MTSLKQDTYLTVSELSPASETKIKGSRFIAHLYHVQNSQKAALKYSELCKRYHDAAHNCYAYRINDEVHRYSDDGEPPGTAGRPIYQVLIGRNLYQVLLVITRYFGGTKLGTGGLTKAYLEAAKSALEQADIITKTRYITINFTTNYEHLNDLLNLVKVHRGIVTQSDYSEKINLEIQIPASKFSVFQKKIESLLKRGINIVEQ
jgi:uncharacterized YigZ family protein